MKTMKMRILTVAILGAFLTACLSGGGSRPTDDTQFSNDISIEALLLLIKTINFNNKLAANSFARTNNGFTFTLENDRTVELTDSDLIQARTNNVQRAQLARIFGDLDDRLPTDSAELNDAYINFIAKDIEDDSGDRILFVEVRNNYIADNGDNDNVGFGIWLINNSESGDISDAGFYIEGNDIVRDVASLTGEASYKGGAYAYHADTAGNKADIFGAVELTANFDTNKIKGVIDQLQALAIGEQQIPPAFATDLAAATINLEETDISSEATWVGATSTTIGDDTYTGRWGGQFFGNDGDKPGYAAGIFNGANADDDAAFVGGYITEQLIPSRFIDALPDDRAAFEAQMEKPMAFVSYDDSSRILRLRDEDEDGNAMMVDIALSGMASDDFDMDKTVEAAPQLARTFSQLVNDDESEAVYADVYASGNVNVANVGLSYDDGSEDVGFRTWVVNDPNDPDPDSGAIISVGFYAFGSDPFSVPGGAQGAASLAGQARYLGGTCFGYEGPGNWEYVFGKVELLANFDTSKISGTINDLKVTGTTTSGLAANLAAATINLEETDISSETAWVGATSATIGSANYTGNWSGSFYGNGDTIPGYASGIFNGTSTRGEALFSGGYTVGMPLPINLAAALPTAPADGAPLATLAGSISDVNDIETATLSDGTKLIYDETGGDGTGTITVRKDDNSLRFATINTDGDDNDDDPRYDVNEALGEGINDMGGVFSALGKDDAPGEDNDVDVDYFLGNAANGNVVTLVEAGVDYGPGGDSFVNFGIWLEVAADGEIVDQLAYAIGSDPFTVANIGGLSGTAIYNGGATAVYASADNNVDIFGNVALTANFDTNMINGAITGLEGGFGTSTEFDTALAAVTAGVVLAPASFATGGTWVGATSTTLAGDAYAGQWGGQFFGNNGAGTAAANQPQYAVGIFNGANTAGDAAFVGGYIAEKQ